MSLRAASSHVGDLDTPKLAILLSVLGYFAPGAALLLPVIAGRTKGNNPKNSQHNAKNRRKHLHSLSPVGDIRVAARWADRLIYLKTVSEMRAELTFGRQRYVQTIGR